MPHRAVLTRVDDHTSVAAAGADAQRLSLLAEPANSATYRAFLARLYGFEAPAELAFQMTAGLTDVIDVRARLHTRLLRSDLAALGIIDFTAIARCIRIPRFHSVLEALGWMYVIERGRMLHSILHRHLQEQLPSLSGVAGMYLGSERFAASRMRELGATLDSVVSCQADVDDVLVASLAAFRAQSRWYHESTGMQRQVA